ncbi:MAG: HD domain-containing protein, partial [Lachnospiraceae bacterium]|nr:HD domain-containing protein [Lachnospiraceae bacterium]
KEHAEDLDLCILDIYMPIMDGYEVIKFLRDYNYLELFPVIVITSDESSENEVRALNQGVSDFIAKPFIREIVEKRVSNVIDSSRNAKELRQMVEEQVSEIYMQQEMLQEQMRQIEEFNEKTMQGLCTIAEFRRGEYGEHVNRIKLFTEILYRQYALNHPELEIPEEKIRLISRAAMLHDIGKVAINDAIVNKPGRLTKEEMDEMKCHCQYGVEVLQMMEHYNQDDMLKQGAEISLMHHERYDGNGYPKGLKGDEIPDYIQIISLADVYDSLVSKRVYKDAYPSDKAVEMILNDECGVFSQEMKDLLWQCMDRIVETYNEHRD